MSYTVTWKPSARDALAEIWLRSAERSSVAGAANSIDVLLRFNPAEQGESREGNSRVLIIRPLAVAFDVHEPDRRVDILAVRELPARRG